MSATIREQTVAALVQAAGRGIITHEEAELAYEHFNERDYYDRHPDAKAAPGYLDREARAADIMRRAGA